MRLNGRRVYKHRTAVEWECLCECGNTTLATSNDLKYGDKKSCGCLNNTMARSLRVKGQNNPMFNVKGEDHPSWKGDSIKQKRNRERKEYENYLWRMLVLKRDKFKCACCGIDGDGKNLNVHHVYNYKDYPDLRFDVENGVTFCTSCHISFHVIFGKRKNNKEQLDRFLILNNSAYVLDNVGSENKSSELIKPYTVKLYIDGNLERVSMHHHLKDIAKAYQISYTNMGKKRKIHRKSIIALDGNEEILFQSCVSASKYYECSDDSIAKRLKNQLVVGLDKINTVVFKKKITEIFIEKVC